MVCHRDCWTLAILCNINTTSGPTYPSLTSSVLPTTASRTILCNLGNPVFKVLAKKADAKKSTTQHSKGGRGVIHRQASLNRLSIPAATSLQNQADGPTPSNPSFPSFANSSNPITSPSPFSSFSSDVGETNPRSRTTTPFASFCTSLKARSRPVHIIRASSIPPVLV